MTVARDSLRQFLALLLASHFVVAELVSVEGRNLDPKIRGGIEAPRGRFPYMGSLQDENGMHRCAAILIEPEWMLTAAHCISPKSPVSLGTNPIVVLGDHNINDASDNNGIEEERIARTFVHPKYVHDDIGNGFDVAVLKLPGPSKISPVAWAGPHDDASSPIPLFLGWGQEGEYKPGEGPMKMAFAPRIDQKTCKSDWDVLKPSMICISSKTADTCKGDSGGPLLIPHRPKFNLVKGQAKLDLLIGIASFGELNCSAGRKPGVFTKVSSFALWIEDVISGRFSESLSLPSKEKASAETDFAKATEWKAAAVEDAPPRSDGELTKKFKGKSVKELNKALGVASKVNNAILVKVLIDLGADVSAVFGEDKLGTLHLAAKEDSVDALKVLIKSGANIEAKDDFGGTPLHAASKEGHVDVVKELIKAKADIEARKTNGDIPLHQASFWGHADVVKELIKAGSPLDAQSSNGETPLHDASVDGHMDVVKELIKGGADVDAQDNDGDTALHEASMRGYLGVVKELIKAGANVNVRGNIGDTPLREASENGHVDIVKVLIENEADKTIKDNFGNTPRDVIGVLNKSLSEKDRGELEKFLG